MAEPFDQTMGKDETRRAWENRPQYEKMVYLYEWNQLLARRVEGLLARVNDLERIVNQAAPKD
jgi:hypothetical protein